MFILKNAEISVSKKTAIRPGSNVDYLVTEKIQQFSAFCYTEPQEFFSSKLQFACKKTFTFTRAYTSMRTNIFVNHLTLTLHSLNSLRGRAWGHGKKTLQAVSVLFWLVSSRLGQFKLIWKRLLLLGKYLELYSIF